MQTLLTYLQKLFSLDYFIFILIVWIIVLIVIYCNKLITHLNSKKVYYVGSKTQYVIVWIAFIFFICYFCCLRIYLWFLRSSINFWIFIDDLSTILAMFSYWQCIFIFGFFFAYIYMVFTFVQVIKMQLKKIYFILLQNKTIFWILSNIINDVLHIPIREMIYKLGKRKILIKGLSKKIVHHYIDHGFTFLLLLIFFMVFIYDLIFNSGLLIYTIKIMPYYLILMLLHSIHSFIVNRGPRQDAIISDIYYNFDNPRTENMFLAKNSTHILHYFQNAKLMAKSDNEFKTDKYYAYRIHIDPPESLTLHALCCNLTENEKKRRIKILKKIGIYRPDDDVL